MPTSSATPASDHISVILPYFDREDSLAAAIESVLQQTHRRLTLYLVNDGSTDSSTVIAHRYRDDRIVHLEQGTNGGVARARNRGLETVETALVAFMDSDDLWLPRKLEAQLTLLRQLQAQRVPVGVVGCGWCDVTTGRRSKDFQMGPFTRLDVLSDTVSGIGTPTLLVDRTVADSSATFDPALPALVDRDYVMSCLGNGSVVAVDPETLLQVSRGRSDHVANPQRASVAYVTLARKYHAELSPELRSLYMFRAVREHLAAGSRRQALRMLPSALGAHAPTRALQFVFGFLAGRRGLAAARKLAGPTR